MAVYFCRHGLATGSDDGTSWANAYRLVNGAITSVLAIGNGHDLLVHSDTITHDATNNRILIDGDISVYGGCDGTEAVPGDRTAGAKTIVDGVDTYACMYIDGTTAVNVFNGFELTQGYGGASSTAGGLRVDSDCEVRDIDINNCTGADGSDRNALIITGAATGPEFYNVDIHDNTSTRDGGAMSISFAAAKFYDCKITDNSAVNGGAIRLNATPFSPVESLFVNCVITGNAASVGGGAIHANDNGATREPVGRFVNCTIANNTVGTGDGVVLSSSVINADGYVQFENCSAWDSSSDAEFVDANSIVELNYTRTRTEWTGTGANNGYGTDPEYWGTGDDPYQLTASSTDLIGEANSGADDYPSEDILGTTRTSGDIGAYEYAGGSPPADDDNSLLFGTGF